MTSSMSRGPASTRSGPSGTSSFSSSCPSAGASRTTSIRRSVPVPGIDRHDDGTDTCCRRRSEMNAQLMPYGILTVLFKHKRAVFGDRSIPTVDRVPTVEMTPSDRRETVLAHAAILGSHDLAETTIESFGLDTVYPDIVDDPPTRWT